MWYPSTVIPYNWKNKSAPISTVFVIEIQNELRKLTKRLEHLPNTNIWYVTPPLSIPGGNSSETLCITSQVTIGSTQSMPNMYIQHFSTFFLAKCIANGLAALTGGLLFQLAYYLIKLVTFNDTRGRTYARLQNSKYIYNMYK